MSTYQPQYLPTTEEILDVFRHEITSLGGSRSEAVDDGSRLFARAVLVPEAQIRPNDSVAAGVALRAVDTEILIHPYTFRKVCTNGAIAARVTGTARIERVETTTPFLPSYEATEAISQIRNT